MVILVATGLWPVELVERAVLCPPVRIYTERRAQSDAPYLLTAHRAVATAIRVVNA